MVRCYLHESCSFTYVCKSYFSSYNREHISDIMPDGDDPFDIDSRDGMPDADDAFELSPLDDSLAFASL